MPDLMRSMLALLALAALAGTAVPINRDSVRIKLGFDGLARNSLDVSSDRDFTLWPKPGTELTLDLDGTSLRLPVVGGRNWFEEAVGDG